MRQINTPGASFGLRALATELWPLLFGSVILLWGILGFVCQ